MNRQKKTNRSFSLHNNLTIILIALSCSFLQETFSQSKDIKFRRYTADDGLMHNTICSVVQDKKGFIWIGTGGGGLSKFDGRSFTNYSNEKNKQGSLGGNTVFSLLLDSRGVLWAGTLDGGVSKYIPETNSFVVFNHSDNNPGTIDNDYVRTLFEDSEGTIYIGTLTGLNLLDPVSGKITRVNCREQGQIFSIIENDKKQIIIGSNMGLLYLDKKLNELIPYSFSDKKLSGLVQDIFPMIQDSKGSYWLGTNKGLVKISDLDEEIYEHFPYDPMNPNSMLTNTDIRVIQQDKEGKIWIGSDKGLSYLDPVTTDFRHYQNKVDDPLSLSDNSIYDIFIDNSNNFWIGTANNGLNFFTTQDPKFEIYQHIIGESNSLNNNIINCFAEYNDMLYIGTLGGGLNSLNKRTGKYKFYTYEGKDVNSISSNNIPVVYLDHDKKLWVGTMDNGLNLFDEQTGRFKRFFEGSRVLSVIDDDNPEYLWIANFTRLIKMHKKTGKFVSFQSGPQADSLNPFPTLVYKTSDKRLWIGNNDKTGLAWFDELNKRFVNYSNIKSDTNSLSNDAVISMWEDIDDHQLWIGTKDGLNTFDYLNNRFKLYTTNNGLPSNNISGIIQDNQGNIWISTHHGLSCFNKSTGEFKNYSKEDGLQGVEFSLNACFKADDGKLYFGGKNGFNTFYPENIKIDSVVSPIVFTGFYINNQPASFGGKDSVLRYHITETKEITLLYKQRSFSIEFVALNFLAPNSSRYAYKLEGFNEDWLEDQSSNKAVFTNVPAGEYVFLAKSSNGDGIYNEKPIKLNISVLPPVWKTIWAYGLYSLVIILTLGLFAKYLNDTASKKQRIKIQKLNDQKEKEIAHLKIEFFTNIAHEIRTPLTLISGPLERLIKSGNNSAEIQEEYELMHKNTRHLMKLVNQLMNFRKIEDNKYTLNYSRVNIVEILRELYTRFTPLARQKNLDFHFVSDFEFIEITLDYELLISAVSNLLTNAFKFTKSTIELSLTKSVDGIAGTFVNNSVLISVRDDGLGIPQEKLKMIFDPFFQIKDRKEENPSFSGIGLGLSYTKSIVELHAGILRVESTPGFGSKFTIELPDKNIEAVPNQSFGLNIHNDINEFVTDLILNGSDNKENGSRGVFLTSAHSEILIVEDNDDLRMFLSKQLQREYIIHLAENGLKALEILKKREIELIITDVMMPEMDGIELCKQVKNTFETSHIPLIILTAKATIDSKVEGTETGADAYVEKPFSFEYLSALIKNLIENRAKLKAKFMQQPLSNPIEIASSKADEKFLNTIHELIMANLSNPDFSIDELAQSISISRSGFHKKLKGISGLTPNDYIKLIRLKKAAELLKEGQLRVNEICDMVGFNSPSYFSKCFQEQFGMLPSDFARM